MSFECAIMVLIMVCSNKQITCFITYIIIHVCSTSLIELNFFKTIVFLFCKLLFICFIIGIFVLNVQNNIFKYMCTECAIMVLILLCSNKINDKYYVSYFIDSIIFTNQLLITIFLNNCSYISVFDNFLLNFQN